jgi:hypothetical protein
MGGQLRPSLALPDPKTSHVELQRTFAAGQGDPLDDELVLRDDDLAGVADFTVARPAPDPRDTVQRQPTIGQFAQDEETETILVHGDLSGWRTDEQATFTGVLALIERQPERPGCRHGNANGVDAVPMVKTAHLRLKNSPSRYPDVPGTGRPFE